MGDIVVIPDPDKKAEEERIRQFRQQLEEQAAKYILPEPRIVIETTCPTCGHKYLKLVS